MKKLLLPSRRKLLVGAAASLLAAPAIVKSQGLGGGGNLLRSDACFPAAPPCYIGPLDLVPGAVVAYGQRALSRAARGTSLYTIRRDSDNATQSFSSDAITGDASVSAISAFIGAGNGFISTWNDQSGNATDAVQATTAQQPTWQASSVGSRPGFLFDGARGTLLASSGNASFINGAYTFFAVCQSGDSTASLFGVNGNVGLDSLNVLYNNDGAGTYFVNMFMVDSGTGDLLSRAIPLSPTLATACVLDGILQSSGGSAAVNGVAQSVTNFQTSPVTQTIANRFVVGDDDPAGDVPWTGKIVEKLVYGSVLSPSDRLAIRQNIAAYYVITL